MIKVSVMYPYAPGARFDHAYYRETHMPLVKRRMGESCRYYSIDRGLAGGSPGTAPTYLSASHIFCDSVEAFQNSFGPHATELLDDLHNFTDVAPVIQISEILVERG